MILIMKIDLGGRLGIAGLILGLISLVAFYLWPNAKWIGWLALVALIVLLVAWAVIEIRQHQLLGLVPRFPFLSAISLAVICGVASSLITYRVVLKHRVPNFSVVIIPPPAPVVQFVNSKTNKDCGAVSSPKTADQEIGRRYALLDRLRNQYILQNPASNPDLLAKKSYPPPEWINAQLKAIGETYVVKMP